VTLQADNFTPTQAPLSSKTDNFSTGISGLVTATSEVFTFHPLGTTEKSTNVVGNHSSSEQSSSRHDMTTKPSTQASKTTEEVFTFHPIGTTASTRSDQVSTAASVFSTATASLSSQETSSSGSFSSSTSTQSSESTMTTSTPTFFSENPKNVLETTTELTSNYPEIDEDIKDPTEASVDSNELENEANESHHAKGTTSNGKTYDEDGNLEKEKNEVEDQTEKASEATTDSGSASSTEDSNLKSKSDESDEGFRSTLATSSSTSEESRRTSSSDSATPTTDGDQLKFFTKSILDFPGSQSSEFGYEATTKPTKTYLYYYFITAIKTNESFAKGFDNSTEVEGEQSMFLGIPGEQSCVVHLNQNRKFLALSVTQITGNFISALHDFFLLFISNFDEVLTSIH
jgi:hypothetical protein